MDLKPSLDDRDNIETCFSRWNLVVEAYSSCLLTKTSDKLVALCGIANLFRTFFRGRYAAGIWEDTLIESLGWIPDELHLPDAQSDQRPSSSCAPSWSRASYNGSVVMQSTLLSSRTRMAHVVDIRIDLLDEHNDKGSVKGSYLILRGQLSCARIVSCLYGKTVMSASGEDIYPDPQLDRSLLRLDDESNIPDHLFCLPLFKSAQSYRSAVPNTTPETHSYAVRGLALSECVSQSATMAHRQFRRIGVWWFEFDTYPKLQQFDWNIPIEEIIIV